MRLMSSAGPTPVAATLRSSQGNSRYATLALMMWFAGTRKPRKASDRFIVRGRKRGPQVGR